MACSRFCSCERSFCMETTMPVGRCVIRTAESVVLTPCPPGPGAAVDVDPQVVGVDLDLGLLDLGHHQHAGGRGVHAALGLGDGHALHPVHPALELEHAEGHLVRLAEARRLHRHRHGAVAAEVGLLRVEDLDLPAAGLGVAAVHLEQVAREQRGLLAALAGLDLDQRVGGVVGVAGREQAGQPVDDRAELPLELVGLRRERRVLGRELPGGGEVLGQPVVLVEPAHDRRELGVAAPDLARERQVGVGRGVGEGGLQLRELLAQVLGRLEHRGVSHARPLSCLGSCLAPRADVRNAGSEDVVPAPGVRWC